MGSPNIVYATLNLNTAFASQTSLTEMTFPLCHLVCFFAVCYRHA